MRNNKKDWSKGDKVKWKIGRAMQYSRGTIYRRLKAGSELKNMRGLVTKRAIGDEITADSFAVKSKTDDTIRIVREGYLKAA